MIGMSNGEGKTLIYETGKCRHRHKSRCIGRVDSCSKSGRSTIRAKTTI